MKIIHSLHISTALALTAMLTLSQRAEAQVPYLWSVSSGNWNVPASWSPNTSTAGPTTIDSATFGSAGTNNNPDTANNTVNVPFTIAALSYTNATAAASPAYQVTSIPSGETLTVSGPVLVGGQVGATAGAALTTYAYMTGGGTFEATGSTFTVQNYGSVSGANATAYLNLSGLSYFVYSNTTGTISIEDNAGSLTRLGGNLTLAGQSNFINAENINLGTSAAAQAGPAGTVTLGAGTNVIYVANFNLVNNKSSFTVANSGGGLRVRGVSGANTDRPAITIANRNVTGTGTSAGTLALNGCSVDIKASTLTIGADPDGSTTGADEGLGLMQFDTGTVDATTILMGISSAAGGTGQGTLTVGAHATLIVGTGGLSLVNQTAGTGSGTLNIATGATVTNNGNITVASTSGTGTLNVGGTLSMADNCFAGTTADPVSALTLSNNATLLFGLPSASQNNIAVNTLNWPANDTTLTVEVVALPPTVAVGSTFTIISFSTFNGTFGTPVASLPTGFTGSLSDNGSAIILTINSTPAPPSVPQNPVATAGLDQVGLTWSASTGTAGPITYDVARSTNSGGEVIIASGLSTTSYTDTNVIQGIEYYYEIYAVNLGLASGASVEVNATPFGPPPVPTNVTAEIEANGVLVSWTADPEATSFDILRSSSSNGTYTTIATLVTGTSYLDTTASAGVTYYYEVESDNGYGPSTGSKDVENGPLLNVNFIDDAIDTAYGGTPVDPVPSAMAGSAVIGEAGDVWNGLGGFTYASTAANATFTSGALVYANGVSSGVTLSLYAPSGSYDANSAGFKNYSPFSWTSYANETGDTGYPTTPWAKLFASCILANSGTTNGYVTINGLAPNGTYDLYTYNASDQAETAGRTSTFTVNGVTQASTYDGATTNLVEAVDYLEFPGVVASATGSLTIEFGDDIASESDFNGFQLIQTAPGTAPPAPVPPIITAVSSPVTNSTAVILCTNTELIYTAAATTGKTISSLEVITSTSTLGGTATNTTNIYATDSVVVSGLGTSVATLDFPLTTNLIYSSVVISATDNTSVSATNTVPAQFDTISPVLVIEASDFNFSGGQWYETPADGGVDLFETVPNGVSGTDYGGAWGSTQAAQGAGYYRTGDVVVTGNAAPSDGIEQKFVINAALTGNTTTNEELEVGYNELNDWLDYTRTFGPGTPGFATGGTAGAVSAPAGTYAIYARMATDGSGEQETMSLITPNTESSGTTQTAATIGSFSFTDSGWSTYDYVPCENAYGSLVSITLTGTETLRATVAGNPNIGFFMLMPVTPTLTPTLLFDYPDGAHPFEPTNSFTFTVGPANGSNIVGSGVDLVLNGVDVTANPNFKLTQSGTSWTGSYPIASNTPYTAVISVTNTAGLTLVLTNIFDTFNPNNYIWELVDYDFSTNTGNTSVPPPQGLETLGGWVSGLFIDNPVPTADTTGTTAPQGTYATNSYFGYPTGFAPSGGITTDPFGAGAIAQQGVDVDFPNDGQSATSELYRSGDGVGTQPAADYVRAKFKAAQTEFSDANIGPFNIGYYGAGYWLNYTRHYPTNNYYVWGRLAGGGGAFSGTTLSILTSGYGAGSQTTNVLGTFSDPNAAGWQTWHWVPLLDTNGNMAYVSLGGLATLKLTSGNNVNAEFLMLAPAPPQFAVTASVIGGQLNLAFPTEIGHSYTLLYKSSLTVPNWTPVGASFPGNGSTTNLSATLSGSQGYYAVSAQ